MWRVFICRFFHWDRHRFTWALGRPVRLCEECDIAHGLKSDPELYGERTAQSAEVDL